MARARRFGSSLGRVLGWWRFQKNRVVARPKMLLTAFRAVNRSLDLWQMSQDVGIRLDAGRNQLTRQWASHHHGAHLRLSLGKAEVFSLLEIHRQERELWFTRFFAYGFVPSFRALARSQATGLL